MDAVQIDDRDFFRIQQEEDRGGIGFLFLAILLHIAVFAASVWLPDLIDHKPLLDDIVTVDLVSMPEPVVTSPPEPVKPAPAPPRPEVKTQPAPDTPPPEPESVSPELTPAPEPVIVPEPVVPVAPVSLAPRKRKIRKAKDTRLAEDKEKEIRKKLALQEKKKKQQQALAQKRRADQKRKRAEQLRKKRAIAAARQAQQEADQAAAVAREELASVIRQSGVRGKPSASSSGRKVASVVLKQYLSSLYQKVHGYWILPEMRQWDRGLETVVVLTIRRDGSVADMQFERKSKDPYFDQFVMKTLRSASPMPRFPVIMSQASIEVGLRFKPGELAM